jgi:hypothetical protein
MQFIPSIAGDYVVKLVVMSRTTGRDQQFVPLTVRAN